MILGFAHITKNCTVAAVAGSWHLVVNAPEKFPLMERRPSRHGLVLQRRNGITEELVEYYTGVVDHHLNRLDVDGDRILLSARDTHAEIKFFRDGLGFDINAGGWIQLTSRLPDWHVRIFVHIDASAPIDPPLDVAGYAALAFYSSDVEADLDRALAAGGRAPTAPFTVKLDREMKIIMLRSPEGTIIELIQVKS